MKSRRYQLTAILKSGIIWLCFNNSIMQANAQDRPANYGLLKPQDASTLPKSRAPLQKGKLVAKIVSRTLLQKTAENEYFIKNGWELAAANDIKASAQSLSQPAFNSASWYNATVPGTVLTTLVKQGVYPDPYWGINNLSIPDTLCRQNWWYRTTFTLPKAQGNKACWLILKGINYEANVWLNGRNIGSIKGAFKRGMFNVNRYLNKNAANALAIQIIPPPHPGIPHEQSVLAQRGPNGGALCQDGPTFISSEGWDWIPGIRDRNIGLWQDVTIRFTSDVSIVDPQIITDLPLPDTSMAAVTIKTGIRNSGNKTEQIILNAQIEGITLQVPVTVKAGETKLVTLSPNDFKQLTLKNPKLWWPNGYGEPNLYKLKLSIKKGLTVSDYKIVRFGVRELSYELSVDAPAQKNWRVEFNPTKVFQKTQHPLFNTAARRNVGGETVIPELNAGTDPALLQDATDKAAAPYLVIKVNGNRIFCKGGNWGMDDGMKRTSRGFLEPYFKLSRDANFNMIRNWTGESTEEVFYDLCDEYGLLVWNDFWTSTENYNVLPLDNHLFLENAKEVIHRFRNHPSIAIWCPRNEGYVPPALELPLAEMVATEDGTRHYQANSRYMNLRTSGPWNYQKDAAQYFTRIADGFSTELGTPSVPTAATMRSMMAKEDLWPIGDVWHYHDFHFGQKDYVDAIDSLYGTATGLDDFCKKAQLVNYDSHRAMFESWNSKLWNNASGMLIWMSHPAWPSTVWQAYSSDYETFGSYYGAKIACEPVHIQLNANNNKVIIANASLSTFNQVKAQLLIFDLQGKKLNSQQTQVSIAANQITDCFIAKLPADIAGVYLVRLELTDTNGKLISKNDYWKVGKSANYKSFNRLSNGVLSCKTTLKQNGQLQLTVTNTSSVPCIGVKLNAQDSRSRQLILPAYFSDGYFNLLPGEVKVLELNVAQKAGFHILANAYNIPENVIASVL
jgi:beta-galactosidase/beta-glucuronidase